MRKTESSLGRQCFQKDKTKAGTKYEVRNIYLVPRTSYLYLLPDVNDFRFTCS